MAGNVREWCWNATGQQRYLLGGSWADPAYMLTRGQLAPPLDRSITNGFRCAAYSNTPLPPALTDPISPRPPPVYLSAAPASKEVFDIYRSIYAYDPASLQAVVESVDDARAQWRRETVRIKAAYGDETILAYLFLPKNRQPPYTCVIDTERRRIRGCLRRDDSSGQLHREQRPCDAVSDFQRDLQSLQRPALH